MHSNVSFIVYATSLYLIHYEILLSFTQTNQHWVWPKVYSQQLQQSLGQESLSKTLQDFSIETAYKTVMTF